MTYSGTIVYIGETKQITDKFSARDLVISNTEEKYPQEVKFQVSGKNCPILDAFTVGDHITVHYNLRGRRYERNGTTTWFSTIEAWRIETPTKVEPKDVLNSFDDAVPF